MKQHMKTSTNVWKASIPSAYTEESVNRQAEASESQKEITPKTETERDKKYDPKSYADEWKKYIPQEIAKKQKKTAPTYDADSWKKYVKPADTEKQEKTAPVYDADSWKKYVKPSDPEKQKKTAPAYDADSWKKYVNPANTEKWKEYAEKAKTAGKVYSANSGYSLSLPACNDFNLFNFAQISAPSGVKIRFKLPFPINAKGLKKLEEQVKNINGTLEAE